MNWGFPQLCAEASKYNAVHRILWQKVCLLQNSDFFVCLICFPHSQDVHLATDVK